MIREDIRAKFPELLGVRRIHGREIDIEETIVSLTRELRPAIAAALGARRELLQSSGPVTRKYAWPAWDEKFEDPLSGQLWTFRQIVQGMIIFLVARANGGGG